MTVLGGGGCSRTLQFGHSGGPHSLTLTEQCCSSTQQCQNLFAHKTGWSSSPADRLNVSHVRVAPLAKQVLPAYTTGHHTQELFISFTPMPLWGSWGWPEASCRSLIARIATSLHSDLDSPGSCRPWTLFVPRPGCYGSSCAFRNPRKGPMSRLRHKVGALLCVCLRKGRCLVSDALLEVRPSGVCSRIHCAKGEMGGGTISRHLTGVHLRSR